MDDVGFTFEELFGVLPDESEVREATRPRTIPTAKYRLGEIKVTPKVGSEQSPYPGRRMAHIQARASVDGEGKGTVFFDLSWETLRSEKGRLDTPSRLWNQLVKAVNGLGQPVPDIIRAIEASQFDASIQEFYIDDALENPFVMLRTPEERREALDNGFELRNRVANIYRAK